MKKNSKNLSTEQKAIRQNLDLLEELLMATVEGKTAEQIDAARQLASNVVNALLAMAFPKQA